MNERELKKRFTDRKVEFPDDGFTRLTVSDLPDRPALLPQWITGLCVVTAMVSIGFLLFTTPVVEQLRLLVDSLGRMEVPPTSAVAVYLGMLMLLGAIGYSVVEAAEE